MSKSIVENIRTGFVPLKACRLKKKLRTKATVGERCKGDFPKTKLMVSTPLLVCRGIAKKFGLRVTGRRNHFGGMIGKRRRPWQSGTVPAFAVLFRSNTHSLHNYRAPIMPETHEHAYCKNPACRASMDDPKEKKNMAKMAQF